MKCLICGSTKEPIKLTQVTFSIWHCRKCEIRENNRFAGRYVGGDGMYFEVDDDGGVLPLAVDADETES